MEIKDVPGTMGLLSDSQRDRRRVAQASTRARDRERKSTACGRAKRAHRERGRRRSGIWAERGARAARKTTHTKCYRLVKAA